MDFSQSVIFEEVALEGLDGITLNTLWLRLKERSPENFQNMDDSIKEKIWNLLLRSNAVQIFVLPQERPRLKTFIPQKDLKEDRHINFKRNIEEDHIYPFCQINDRHNRGSCSTYFERTPLSETESREYHHITQNFGDKLVVVSSQQERTRCLLNGIDGQLSPTLYCLLERIGRARHSGVHTVSGTVLLKIVNDDPKNIYRFKKMLLNKKLIKENQTSLVGASVENFTNLTNTRVIYLSRFFGIDEVAKDVPVEETLNFIQSRGGNCLLKEAYRYLVTHHAISKTAAKRVVDSLVTRDLVHKFLLEMPRKVTKKKLKHKTMKVSAIRLVNQTNESIVAPQADSSQNQMFSCDDQYYNVGMSSIEQLMTILQSWYPEFCTIVDMKDRLPIRFYELRSYLKFFIEENILEVISLKDQDYKYRLTRGYAPPYPPSLQLPLQSKSPVAKAEKHVSQDVMKMGKSPGILSAHRKMAEYEGKMSGKIINSTPNPRDKTTPRYSRLSLFHEYLIYLLRRDHNMTPVGQHCFNSANIPIYSESNDWRMFVPPLDSYDPDMCAGWMLGIDVAYHIPMEVLLVVLRVELPTEVREAVRGDPLGMFVPLINFPSSLVKMLIIQHRMFNKIRNLLKYMTLMGLTSVVKTFEGMHAKRMPIYLHRKVRVRDTAALGEERDFGLCSREEVAVFWREMRTICLNTPKNMSARGQTEGKEGKSVSIALEGIYQSMYLLSVADLKNIDTMPGDGRGAGGTASQLMTHYEGHWLRCEEKPLHILTKKHSRPKVCPVRRRQKSTTTSTPKKLRLSSSSENEESVNEPEETYIRWSWSKREDVLLVMTKSVEMFLTRASRRQIRFTWQSINSKVRKYCPGAHYRKNYRCCERRYNIIRRHYTAFYNRVCLMTEQMTKKRIKQMARVPFTMKNSQRKRLYDAFNELMELIMTMSNNLSKTNLFESVSEVPPLEQRNGYFNTLKLVRRKIPSEETKIIELLHGWIYTKRMGRDHQGGEEMAKKLGKSLKDCNSKLIDYSIIFRSNSLFGYSSRSLTTFTSHYLSAFSSKYSAMTCLHSFYCLNDLGCCTIKKNNKLLETSRTCLDTLTVLFALGGIGFSVKIPAVAYQMGRDESLPSIQFESYESSNHYEDIMDIVKLVDHVEEDVGDVTHSGVEERLIGPPVVFEENKSYSRKRSMDLKFGFSGDLYSNMEILNLELQSNRPINESLTRFTSNTDDNVDSFYLTPLEVDYSPKGGCDPPLIEDGVVVDTYKRLTKMYESLEELNILSRYDLLDISEAVRECGEEGMPIDKLKLYPIDLLEEMISSDMLVLVSFHECHVMARECARAWMILGPGRYFLSRPWRSFNGSLMIPALRHLLEGMLTRLAQIGMCSVESVLGMFDPFLSVGDCVDLLEVLWMIGCIRLRRVVREDCGLFGDSSGVRIVECGRVTQLYVYLNMAELHMVVNVDCFIKCGQFIHSGYAL